MQSIDSFIRAQGLTSAVINVVLNPVIAWIGNRQMDFVPLVGGNGIVVDTAVTSIVLSLLVALFAASGARRALRRGRIQLSGDSARTECLLSHLPKKAWALGLLIGFGIACILTPLTFGLFYIFGVSGLSFAEFALFKAIYTGLLGFAVTRGVILRQLLIEITVPR